MRLHIEAKDSCYAATLLRHDFDGKSKRAWLVQGKQLPQEAWSVPRGAIPSFFHVSGTDGSGGGALMQTCLLDSQTLYFISDLAAL